MNKITCNVIKDILPLYIDGVVSEDTQKNSGGTFRGVQFMQG